MQRVSATKGDFPAIVVVPHGFDDTNTTIIGEQIIREIDCFGVINYGWERADKFDYYKDKANCNNIRHLSEDVIFQEFLEPILRFSKIIENSGFIPNVFIIHGVSNDIQRGLKDPPEIILGTGNGDPPSWSCDQWVRDGFAALLKTHGMNVYFGKSGGKYSGRDPNNLNQLFNTNYGKYISAQSLQLEIVRELRSSKDKSKMTGDVIAMCIEDIIEAQQSWEKWTKTNFGTYKEI